MVESLFSSSKSNIQLMQVRFVDAVQVTLGNEERRRKLN